MAAGRVLFVDNNSDFVATRALYLRKAGYQVVIAPTLEEARSALEEHHVHLAIVDVRMVNDRDELDTSGLAFARDPRYRALPKIILTGYPQHQAAVDVMHPEPRGLPVAVDYLSKGETAEILVLKVERVIREYVRIDDSLRFRWMGEHGPGSFLQLADLLAVPDDPLAAMPARAAELEDLFRRLFRGHDQVTLARMLWCQGSAAALEVNVYRGWREQVSLVTCVRGAAVHTGLALAADGDCSPIGAAAAEESLHYALTSYGCRPVQVDELKTLGAFCAACTERQMRAALATVAGIALDTDGERAMDEDIGVHYRDWLSPGTGVAEDLRDESGARLAIDELINEARARDLAGLRLQGGRLELAIPGRGVRVWADPLAAVRSGRPWAGLRAPGGAQPYDLAADKVLVDTAGRAIVPIHACPKWPVWHALAALELDLRRACGAPEDWAAAVDFEVRLLHVVQLNERIAPAEVDSAYSRVLIVTNILRQGAATVLVNDPRPYYVALLACALQELADGRPGMHRTPQETRWRVYCLVLASLLCEHLAHCLENLPHPVRGVRGTHFDINEKEQSVEVNGAHVQFTDVEFRLFQFLFDNVGELCTRKDIAREVFQVDDALQAKGLIDTNISRLRGKLARAPQPLPRIETVKRKGYRLVIATEADGGEHKRTA